MDPLLDNQPKEPTAFQKQRFFSWHQWHQPSRGYKGVVQTDDEPHDENKEAARPSCSPITVLTNFLLAVLLVIVMTGAVCLLLVHLSPFQKTLSHTTTPSCNVTLYHGYEWTFVRKQIIVRDISRRDDLDVPGTPQYQALHAADLYERNYTIDKCHPSFLGTHVMERALEHYILAVVYYSNGGNVMVDHLDDSKHLDIRLKELNLAANGLVGTIPKELGGLPYLTVLNLSANELNGTIPSALGQYEGWPYLTSLDLARNQLTGTIPTTVGRLSDLVVLDFHLNQLTGSIPTALGRLTSLTSLDLRGTHLNGTIPTELGLLTNLRFLDLSINDFSGTVPTSLAALVNLEYLGLALNNRLEGNLTSIFCHRNWTGLYANCKSGNMECTCCTGCA